MQNYTVASEPTDILIQSLVDINLELVSSQAIAKNAATGELRTF